MSAPALDPSRTALLVMDYQRDIVARLDDGPALVERVASVIGQLRPLGVQVGYVRVAFTDDDYAAVPPTNATFAAAAASGRLREDDPGTAIVEPLAPREGDVVVRKTRVGAFSTTDLADHLDSRGVDTLVLAGLSTSGVVLSTVRDAADRDYRLVVVSDLCADPDPDAHRVLVERVFPRQASVVTAAELLARFS